MPQAPTPVVPTRPRLGFSIESLVGCGDEKRRSASPPAVGFTKLPESPPHPTSPRDSPGSLTLPRDFLLAREQQFRDQLRDQLLKEQILRVQQALPQHRTSPLTSPGRTHSPRDNHHLQEEEKKTSSPSTPPPLPNPLPPPNFLPGSGMPLPPQLLPLGGHTIQPHLPTPLMPHPLLAQGQVPQLGTPLPPAPCPRDYPLYPWLLSRHGRIFPPGFPGGKSLISPRLINLVSEICCMPN